MKCFQICRVAV